MKRYKVNLGLHISAKSKKEAFDLVSQIISSGQAVSKDGRWLGITLKGYDPKTIEKLPL